MREGNSVGELREKIKNFLASQGMIKGHSAASAGRSSAAPSTPTGPITQDATSAANGTNNNTASAGAAALPASANASSVAGPSSPPIVAASLPQHTSPVTPKQEPSHNHVLVLSHESPTVPTSPPTRPLSHSPSGSHHSAPPNNANSASNGAFFNPSHVRNGGDQYFDDHNSPRPRMLSIVPLLFVLPHLTFPLSLRLLSSLSKPLCRPALPR